MGCKMCISSDNGKYEIGVPIEPRVATNMSTNANTSQLFNATYQAPGKKMMPAKHSNSDIQIPSPISSNRSQLLLSSNLAASSPQPTTAVSHPKSEEKQTEETEKLVKPESKDKIANTVSIKAAPQVNMTFNTSLFRKENKQSIYSNYEMLEVLGKGSFGEVKKCQYKATGEIRAVKIIDKLFIVECDSMVSEIKALKELDHPNILKLYEFYQDAQNYYLVTEYCAGKELFDKIVASKYFSEMKAAKILQQVLSAVVYCHRHNICHRDLKPENLLLEEDSIDSNIKVIDFGTSKFCTLNERMKEKYGTPYYIAPEVIKKDYNMKCDVWSCGVILFIMLSGHPPFGGRSNDEIMNRVLDGKYSFQRKEWLSVSELAKELINKMLTYDSSQRISSEEALNHPWIKKYTVMNESTEDLKLSLDALNKFTVGQNLQVATLAFFAVQMQNKSDESKFRRKFKALDANNDGMLSREELINGFTDIYKDSNKAQIEVDEVMGKLDVNKDGTINYTEFLMAHMEMSDLITNERLRTAFQSFDLVLK